MEAGLLPAGDPAVHIVEALAAWRKLFGGYDPAPDAPVLLFPGASRQDKAWPPESFASLARLLARRGKKAHWVLGPVEQERRFPVPPDISVHAPQDLPALAALLRSAALAVGNDSGPLHLAAMHGVPVLSLFGPTDPDIWRPLEGHVLTKLSIPPEQVLETALGLLWTGPEQNARP
jgi:ADP-heptose:LPS heptosyltransferase